MNENKIVDVYIKEEPPSDEECEKGILEPSQLVSFYEADCKVETYEGDIEDNSFNGERDHSIQENSSSKNDLHLEMFQHLLTSVGERTAEDFQKIVPNSNVVKNEVNQCRSNRWNEPESRNFMDIIVNSTSSQEFTENEMMVQDVKVEPADEDFLEVGNTPVIAVMQELVEFKATAKFDPKAQTSRNHRRRHLKKEVIYTEEEILARPNFCTICGKRFSQKCGLVTHMRIHTGERPYQCDRCPKTFGQKGNFSRHVQKHLGITVPVIRNYYPEWICSVCSKAFCSNSDLKRHIMGHTGERPYHCDVCGRGFTQNAHLKYHSKLHTEMEKTHTCPLCGRQYTRLCNLKVHLRRHEGKRFHCSICTLSFFRNTELTKHNLVHTGEKPYKCEYCPRAYADDNELNHHKLNESYLHIRRQFDKNKTRQCDFCGKMFARKITILEHIKAHLGIRPFKCDNCFRTFARERDFRKHNFLPCSGGNPLDNDYRSFQTPVVKGGNDIP